VELTVAVVLLGTVASIVLGLSKTCVPSAGAFGVALLATVLPPLPSTGVALPVLLVGDLIAIRMYARHVDLRLLVRLIPSVVVGLGAGFALIRLADAGLVARLIGAILLVSAAAELIRRRRARLPVTGVGLPTEPGGVRARGPVSLLLGAGAGLSTMVANAGGPMMTLYLLRMRVTTLAFLGTVAWFFFVVNMLKLPFSIGLGLITAKSLVISATLVPGMVVGAVAGRRLVQHLSPERFELVALVATAVAGLWLVVA
jgi:uncharacterized membrane protein YfcA